MQIGELAKLSGLNASRIRFYEAQGLISVSRRANGYRTYSDRALTVLNIITRAQNAGFSLEEIRRLMPSGSSRWHNAAPLAALRKKVADMRAAEEHLAQTRSHIEALIADIENKPEGMSCEANTARVLRHFQAQASPGSPLSRG